MRICKDCNVEMLEDKKVYMTSMATGDTITCGSKIVIEKEPTKLQKKFNMICDTEKELPLYTVICPCCGKVESYLGKDRLEQVKQYYQDKKNYIEK